MSRFSRLVSNFKNNQNVLLTALNVESKFDSNSCFDVDRNDDNKLLLIELKGHSETTGSAYVEYKLNNKKTVILVHTFVPPILRGQGVGHKLAKEVFDFIKSADVDIHVGCDFLQKYYKDNLHEDSELQMKVRLL